MASDDAQHVVKTMSTGESSSVDSHANQVSATPAHSDSALASTNPTPSKPSVQPENGARAAPADPTQPTRQLPDTAASGQPVASAGDDGTYTSDTDGSRPDSIDHIKDGQSKDAKSIVTKKPTSFKSVSVTKTFLAKATSAPSATKIGDKVLGSNTLAQQSVIKPRLIAKSGVSTLRDAPRLKSTTDGTVESAGGVWNKNRPAPAQPAKQFTDEELKQQYGIHLAERLRSDGSNANKWADLDDDEDEDWAPETVEWMDGTKSTIVPSDNLSPATAKATLAAVKRDNNDPPIKPTLTALKRPVINGPLKTILRPGAAQQAKQDGTSRTNTPAQTPSGGTPGASAPSKSPWATLPPVEKFAAVYSPPTQHAQPHRSEASQRDAHGFDAMPAPPAREIEAESFDRSWREGERQPARELFNSQSGRYEPAPENRKSMNRGDARPTSLLHRGSNTGASYQVDGGAERRTSNAKPSQDARTGIVIGHNLAPQTQDTQSDQAQQAQQAAQDRAKEYERQQKLMREKRAEAIARRQEQARQEEEAKQERIRLKMQSLPPLEKPRKEPVSAVSQAPATGDVVEPTPVTRDTPHNPHKQRHDEQADRVIDAVSGKKAGSLNRPAEAPTETPLQANNAAPPPSTNQNTQAAFKSPALNAESFSTWGTPNSNKSAPNVSSVWAPGSLSSGGRRIGNGAFDNSFTRISPHLQRHQQQEGAPVGQRPRAPSQDLRQQDTSPMMHQQILSDQFVTSLGLNDESMDDRLASGRAVAGGQAQLQQGRAYQPAPIGPPARVVSMHDGQARTGTSAWGQFAAQAQGRAEMDPSFQHRARDEPRPTVTQNPQRWKETFKQTRVQGEWLGAPREVMSSATTVHEVQPQMSGQQHLISGLNSPLASSHAAGAGQQGTVRLPSGPSSEIRQSIVNDSAVRVSVAAAPNQPQQSRFFPTAPYGASPPPEEAEHPVFAGASGQPHVHLPTPRANVRLPPASGNRAVSSHAHVAPSEWQARINGLLNRTNSGAVAPLSPPKTPPEVSLAKAAPPSSISAAVLELNEPYTSKSTTVSLPRSSGSSAAASVEDLSTKSSVEALFDGELSFGSTPRVFVPRQMAYHNREPVTKSSKHQFTSKHVDSQTKSLSAALQELGKGAVTFVISLAFSKQPAKEVVARKSNKSNLSDTRSKKTHHGKHAKDSETPKASPKGSPVGKKGPGSKESGRKAGEGDERKTPNKKESGQLKPSKTRLARAAKAQQANVASV